MKKKKEEGNVLVFHVFIHLSVYSSVHPSVRPLCLIVFGGRERERERLARTVELLPDRFNGSFICLLFVPGYTTTVTLQSTHTHTPPFFFSFVFFLLVCVADAVYFPLYYCHLIFPPLPFSFFFFFLIYFFLFIYLFIFFFFIRGASFHFVVRRDLALARTQTSQSTNKSNSTSECNVITCVFYSTEEGEKEER